MKKELVLEKARLLEFLLKTDWLVVRQAETGVKMTEEILAQRAKARTRIDEIRELLNA